MAITARALRPLGTQTPEKRPPSATAQVGKESTIIEEVFVEDLWYTQVEMAMRCGL
jgi:hypothetical protein